MAAQASPYDDLKRAISPTAEIIEEAREGRMFILVDAEDRENEGDLVIPAQFATPGQVNFMAKHGRGLICLTITPQRTQELGLEPMTPHNRARNRTAFTVSIEAKEGISTGISAHDRAHTIAVAIDHTKGAEDIVSPGHVFPLAAREGGVLMRAGHTEASVDIARLAGLNPSAVICEIMSEDGSMARLPELISFAQFHNLKIGTIADLIAYRRAHDHYIEKLAERPIDLPQGRGFRLHVFKNTLDGLEHIAMTKGEINPDQPTLVRVHRADVLGDIFGAGERAGLLQKTLAEIEAEGGGALVVLRTGMSGDLLRALDGGPAPVDGDDDSALRVIGVGAQILRELGVRRMKLLSNAPHRVAALEGFGLTIDEWRDFKS